VVATAAAVATMDGAQTTVVVVTARAIATRALGCSRSVEMGRWDGVGIQMIFQHRARTLSLLTRSLNVVSRTPQPPQRRSWDAPP
jgi:hypothetical protein